MPRSTRTCRTRSYSTVAAQTIESPTATKNATLSGMSWTDWNHRPITHGRDRRTGVIDVDAQSFAYRFPNTKAQFPFHALGVDIHGICRRWRRAAVHRPPGTCTRSAHLATPARLSP